MLNEGFPSSDGAMIARSVRELARKARRVLGNPDDEAGVLAVFEAIEILENQLEPGSAKILERWLASLRKQVECGLAVCV